MSFSGIERMWERAYGAGSHGRAMTLESTPAHACSCSQCGAPREAHGSVCAYCLSPSASKTQAPADLYAYNVVQIAAERRIADLIEITCLEDAAPRYVAAPQPATIWK